MIVYLTKDFTPTDKANAIMAKVIPDNGDAPYFIAVNKDAIKAGYIEGGVPEINARYNKEIVAAMTTYFEGGASTAPRNSFRAAMTEAFNSAMDTGWVDGGQALPLDEDAAAWLDARLSSELAYIDDLFVQIKNLRKEDNFDFFKWVTAKADRYTSTAISVYNAAVLLAKKNQMLTWNLGQTEKHCDTCLSLDGNAHRASWYISHDYIPRKPGAAMDCNGYNCDCRLTDSKGEEVTI
jgi:hypothetical protein